MRKRKPRGIKKSGQKSWDLCKGCYYRGCDPANGGSRADKKIRKRLSLGLCPACGHDPCTCKSR